MEHSWFAGASSSFSRIWSLGSRTEFRQRQGVVVAWSWCVWIVVLAMGRTLACCHASWRGSMKCWHVPVPVFVQTKLSNLMSNAGLAHQSKPRTPVSPNRVRRLESSVTIAPEQVCSCMCIRFRGSSLATQLECCIQVITHGVLIWLHRLLNMCVSASCLHPVCFRIVPDMIFHVRLLRTAYTCSARHFERCTSTTAPGPRSTTTCSCHALNSCGSHVTRTS